MQLDIDRNFGEIISSEVDFRRQLLELQTFTITREQHHVWATNLRFITLPEDTESQDDEQHEHANESMTSCALQEESPASVNGSTSIISSPQDECGCDTWPSFYGRQQTRRLRLTEKGSCPNCCHYVAISYRWRESEEGALTTERSLGYNVETLATNRASRAPTDILCRAISYAAHYDLSFIWIDQECIMQEDDDDKETGIQSMDLVYQRTRHPVGLLNAYFDSQTNLTIFEHLLEGILIPVENMRDLANVLEILKDDEWFTRAWILQESTAGGLDMQLLARHNPALKKSVCCGNIPGELQFSIFEMHSAITWAEQCMAEHEAELSRSVLRRLRKATETIWKSCPSHIPTSWDRMENDPEYRQTCNAAQALSFMATRHNSYVPDRVAILGNMCNYAIRVDTRKVQDGAYSFTTCALALSIFNGDLSLMRNNTAGVFDRLGFSWGPPRQGSLSRLTYIEEDDDLFRLQPAKLTKSGLQINGLLWRMDRRLDLRAIQTHFSELRKKSDAQNLAIPPTTDQFLHAKVIWLLLRKLIEKGFVSLANTVWEFTNRYYLGPRSISERKETVVMPTLFTEVIEPHSGSFIYANPPYAINCENDFREFFDDDSAQSWRGSQWLVDSILVKGCIVCGHIVASESSPEIAAEDSAYGATFNVAETGHHVFTPSTVLDTRLTRTAYRSEPISWLLEPCPAAGPRHGVGQAKGSIRGYWRNDLQIPASLYTLA